MNILSKFTIKNLKLNKKRSIVTGIGIVLSAALICAVCGMVTSVRQTMINTVKNDGGDFHTAYYNVPQSELKYIEENQKVKSYFCTSDLGWSYLQDSKNKEKPYARVVAFTKEAFSKRGIKLSEGRFPGNADEVVIPEHLISNARINKKIGDSITLNLGDRVSQTGEILDQSVPPIINPETLQLSNETIKGSNEKTYKIVGIIQRPDYNLENYNCPGYTLLTYIDNINNSPKADIYVRYNNAKDYEQAEKEILAADTGKDKYNKKTNTELLRYEGAMSEATLKVLYTIALIVMGIIVVSSVFVIRNSFSISVAEKNKQYGMLSSIGATKKQIRKSVLLEGFVIGAVAIPLGILFGILAVVILIWIMNTLLLDMLNGVTFVYSVPLIPILGTVVLSAITIYLSCLIPSIKASKISPIDSIRGSNDVKIKAKKLKTSKWFKKVFGIGGTIARKNLKRSKKKYRTTIISLVVSIATFISLSSFISYGKKMTSIYYTELTFNMSVRAQDESMYNEITKMNGIEKYAKYHEKLLKIDMEKYGTEDGKKANEKIDEPNISLLVINDEYYKEYLKEIGESQQDFDKKAILIDEMMITQTDGKKSVKNALNVKETDIITVGQDEDTLNIQITKKTDKRPMGYEGGFSVSGMVFVSESYAKNIQGLGNSGIILKASNTTELENQINKLKESNINYADANIQNLDTYVEQSNRLFLIISIFLFGFIGVITLIGVTNIFNTITTNMILRSKEFAMLKSIGMTTKEFNKMIRLESILYGLKSLLIGIPIGLAGSYFIYKSFAQSTDVGYIFPVLAILIATIFVFIIVGFTMKYSLNKINKQNIIETIRNDNI